MKGNFWLLLGVVIVIAIFPGFSEAVLPPNILFSLGSQIFTVVSTIGIVVASVITVVTLFWKQLVVKVKSNVNGKRNVLIIIFSLIVFLVLLAFYVIYRNSTVLNTGSHVSQNVTHQNAEVVNTYHFFSDRFILATDQGFDGKPFLVDIISSRKQEESGDFLHYYITNLIDGARRKKVYDKAIAAKPEVLTSLVFSEFEKIKAEDNSTREQFSFAFSVQGKEYHVVTEELQSDFIIKNEPEYTSYVSVGMAKVSNGKQTVPMHIMYQASYSNDYRKKVFFDERDELLSETTQLIVWGKEGGEFFLVDQSRVQNPIPAYRSHFWMLYKDSNDFLKKGFAGSVIKQNKNGKVVFEGATKDFVVASFSLGQTRKFSDELDKGWVEGVMNIDGQAVSAYGMGYNIFYGKEE